jgi:hypothetical protein
MFHPHGFSVSMAKQITEHASGRKLEKETGPTMPTLFRFSLIGGCIAAVIYGIIFWMATGLQPEPRELTVVVPPAKYAK